MIVWSNKSSVKKSWLDRYCEMSFNKEREGLMAEIDVAGLIQEIKFSR